MLISIQEKKNFELAFFKILLHRYIINQLAIELNRFHFMLE